MSIGRSRECCMGPVITSSSLLFLFYSFACQEKPEKNPNNALDFGLRASIFEVIISFLPTSTKGRASLLPRRNHGSQKSWLGHGILLLLSFSSRWTNAKAQTAQTFSFFPPFLYAVVCFFLWSRARWWLVFSLYDWALGNPKTTKFSQWFLPLTPPSSRKQKIREKSLITVPVYSGRNAIPFPSWSFLPPVPKKTEWDWPINQSHRKEEENNFLLFLFLQTFVSCVVFACDGCIRNPSYRRGMQAHPEKVVEIEGEEEEAFYSGVDNVNDKDDSDRVWSVRSTWPTLYISRSRERKTWCSPKSGRIRLKLQKKIDRYIYLYIFF